ncbi:MAG TPA: rhamnulokinase family protein [Pirellulales bacterium]|jgi:rhamnulokinase|nr:rhamnulokinase family protein [Pirellulales bacterium]
MAEKVYLAVDLGASGGRVFAGLFDGQSLRLQELHRFEHSAIAMADGLYWNLLHLWQQIGNGLRVAAGEFGSRVRSVGVDTWGVDFALLGRGDVLLENPHSYRDPRATGVMDRAAQRVSRAEIFGHTGVQFLGINTLDQLLAMREQNSPLLDVAETFLMMPDLFHWLLTGQKSNEFTNATTTQMFDPARHGWATAMLEKLGLPTTMFPPLVEPGTRLGPLRKQVARDVGLAGVEVVAPATHDTASAVLAVPASPQAGAIDWCYISSGTWSLMGVEMPQPVLTPACLAHNFTNEGGVGRTIRLLKNITGLWLVQECRRVWVQAGREYHWETLSKLAGEAKPYASFIDPDAAQFQAPCDMPEMIRTYCRETKQLVPSEDGAIIRTCLDSIAMRYRQVLIALEELTGHAINTIHIVGGGAHNRELCQTTVDVCRRAAVAGPVEATVIGNVLMQAIADGQLGSIAEARELARRSFPVERYEPRGEPADAAFARFVDVTKRQA